MNWNFSPLEGYLVTDLTFFFYKWPIVSFSVAVLFIIVWLPLFIGAEFVWVPSIWDQSNPDNLLDSEYEDGESDSFEDISTSTTFLEENALWSFEFFLVSISTFGLMNICGLLPWGASQGALLGLTFLATWSFFLQVNFVGFSLNKFSTTLLFLAPGAHILMRLALWAIEFFSYCLRAFTLGIRLFANLLAGHSLVHIILSGIWFFLLNGVFLLSGFQSILLFLILLMEFSVSLVQAFVLAILLSLYFQEHLLVIPNHSN